MKDSIQNGSSGSTNGQLEKGSVSTCERCSSRFRCNPKGECWCMKVPPVKEPDLSKSCLCPKCLKELI